MNHKDLVKRSATWLANHGAVVVCTEVVAWACPESPDVMGWKYDGLSMMIECKVSRSDFLADKDKPHRNGRVCGLGNFRYYASLPGVIKRDEVPDGWGLIETSGHGMKIVKQPHLLEAHEQRERVLLIQMVRYGWQPDWRDKHNVEVDRLPVVTH